MIGMWKNCLKNGNLSSRSEIFNCTNVWLHLELKFNFELVTNREQQIDKQLNWTGLGEGGVDDSFSWTALTKKSDENENLITPNAIALQVFTQFHINI
jgi:hypothetical protein